MFDVTTTVVVLHVAMTTTVSIFIGCHFLFPTFSPSHFGIIKSNSLHKYDATQLTGSVLPHVYNFGCTQWGVKCDWWFVELTIIHQTIYYHMLMLFHQILFCWSSTLLVTQESRFLCYVSVKQNIVQKHNELCVWLHCFR